MPRKMSKKTETEYDRLKLFFKIAWQYQLELNPSLRKGLPPESDPIYCLEKGEKKYSKTFILSGLKDAVNDEINSIINFSSEKKQELARRLASNNAPSLQEMLGRYFNKIRKIIERGKIRNDEEYYLVKELAIEMDSDVLTKSEHKKIQNIFYDYEFKGLKRVRTENGTGGD